MVTRLLNRLFGLPDLKAYAIPPVPTRPEVETVPDNGLKENETVRDGTIWRTVWEAPLTVSMDKKSTVSKEPTSILDAYDIEALKDGGLQADDRAKVMKWHWSQGDSAQMIEKKHTSGTQLESGYSTRNAAKYVKAFYQAKAQRESMM